MTIGQRIAQKRKELGLSQETLGEKLGVSRQSVYKWEADGALPEIDKLIAMSRLFDVTVGWLLGVEEAESAEGQEPESAGGELNEEQLNMVQEIVERYIAAQQPKRRRRWPWMLGAVAAVALIWTLAKLGGELDTLNSRYNNLQNSVSNISSSVNYQISGIADRVEEILKSQNSLLASHSVKISGWDLRENIMTMVACVTPKTFVEGMEAMFIVDTGAGPVEYPAVLQSGQEFTAEITCPLTDSTTVSVIFITGDTRQTQVIHTATGLYTGTFPEVYPDAMSMLMWRDVNENGEITFGAAVNDYVLLPYADRTSLRWDETHIPPAEVREVRMGLFKNQKLVAWLEPCQQPDSFVGDFSKQQFFRMPDITVSVTGNDVITVGALVTDEYERQKLYVESLYMLDEDGKSLVWAESEMQENENWYDTNQWSY